MALHRLVPVGPLARALILAQMVRMVWPQPAVPVVAVVVKLARLVEQAAQTVAEEVAVELLLHLRPEEPVVMVAAAGLLWCLMVSFRA